MTPRAFYALLFAAVFLLRLAHTNITWVEEGYPLAAAAEMLRGKSLYNEIWFDKPPLFPAFYMLWGATTGIPLRLAGALYVLLSAWSIGRLARHLWSETEERLAAALTAFFLTFGIPATVMVIGPDLMLIPIQAAAVLAAWRGQALAAGLITGIGMLINGKMLIFLPAVLVLRPLWAVGFLLPQIILLPAAQNYYQQVWAWGSLYSRDTFLTNPLAEGLQRTANWLGFHSAIVLAAAIALRNDANKRRWLIWLTCGIIAVTAGFRFAPRYYFLLIPPVLILAARALPKQKLLAALLLIPLIRFGPRYLELASDNIKNKPHQWRDLAMEQDSRAAAKLITAPGTILVWGYRPEIYPLSGHPAATRFLDSQPLTGVLADRHLTDSRPTAPELAKANRAELIKTKPEWILDGLGPYNLRLAITEFEDLKPWLANYTEVARTPGTTLYKIRDSHRNYQINPTPKP